MSTHDRTASGGLTDAPVRGDAEGRADTSTIDPTRGASGGLLRRIAPLLVLIVGFVAFFALGLDRYVSFDALRDNRQALTEAVSAQPILVAAAYLALYTIAVAFSLPIGLVLTISGGFLFGTVVGTGLTVVGATFGAVAVFLVARSSLGLALRARAGPFLKRVEEGFCENALNYLFVLRLVPLFPFWLVNIVPALLNVRLSTFVLGTAIGIVPGTAVYANLGASIGAVFDAGGEPDLGLLFHPRILTAIGALTLLALVPVAYRAWKKRRT